ncbi:CRP-like cAMP-binding protein [Sphaerotilus hippei]|uniref:CRP-like cAMP-binding protein n=1 Tax=Sphaerotilus hippei TaxID=744406 RepID=A0A318GVM0_9BURK|nr:Crp/Fnr family transcriptional regulator [Sphaerotilus hippei]PXW93562.1 CRP-like cAMP-binding protein [Sphaerotilus hippei]
MSSVVALQPLPRGPYNPQAEVCASCSVRQFALFGALDEAALQRLHCHIADLRLEEGQSLYDAQQNGSAVFTVRSGVVRLERCSDAGERRIMRLAGRTDLLGLEALLGQTYAADAVACTPVQVCRIPRVLIEELSAEHAALTRDLMKRWQRALDDADEWLVELSRGPARQRMLRLLLKLSEYSDVAHQIWLPTRQDMGAMLDMTFETASRLISALRREGVLEPIDARHARLSMDRLMAALKDQRGAGSV